MITGHGEIKNIYFSEKGSGDFPLLAKDLIKTTNQTPQSTLNA